MDQVPVLGRLRDNPLCHRVQPEHLLASSYEPNRRDLLSGQVAVELTTDEMRLIGRLHHLLSDRADDARR